MFLLGEGFMVLGGGGEVLRGEGGTRAQFCQATSIGTRLVSSRPGTRRELPLRLKKDS